MTGAGRYTVTWQGVNDAGVPVATGVYFYKLVAGDYVSTRKIDPLEVGRMEPVRRLVIIVLLLFPAVTAAQPVARRRVDRVWSDEVTFNARAARPGSVVRAYDPDGVPAASSP